MDKKDYFDHMSNVWDARFYTPDLLERLACLVEQFGLQNGTRLLDVGTGTGGLLPLLLNYVGNEGFITAIDFSERMVQKASDKFRDRENLKFITSSVENLSFKPGFFDYVICFGAFPHFKNKEKALSEMHIVLEEGGKLFIAHALSSVELKNHHQCLSLVAHDVLPEEVEMRRMMEGTGFAEVSIIDREKCYICRGEKRNGIFNL